MATESISGSYKKCKSLAIGEYKNGLFEGDYITNKKGLVKVQLFPNDYTFRISKKNKEKVITKSITNDLRIKCNLSLF
jgi:hypothetical protein